MDPDQKLQIGLEYKEKGNAAIKEQNYKSALSNYNHAILYLKGLDNDGIAKLVPQLSNNTNPVQKEQVKQALISTLSNICLCYLKMQRFQELLRQCNEILKLDPSNAKVSIY
jgi:FK506-binding protein 8